MTQVKKKKKKAPLGFDQRQRESLWFSIMYDYRPPLEPRDAKYIEYLKTLKNY